MRAREKLIKANSYKQGAPWCQEKHWQLHTPQACIHTKHSFISTQHETHSQAISLLSGCFIPAECECLQWIVGIYSFGEAFWMGHGSSSSSHISSTYPNVDFIDHFYYFCNLTL